MRDCLASACRNVWPKRRLIMSCNRRCHVLRWQLYGNSDGSAVISMAMCHFSPKHTI
jgi:hypothetical protein